MDSHALLNNPLLDFTEIKLSKSGMGDIIEQRSEYKGLKFIIKESGYIELQGSLHKYFNDGLHNYNDFTFDDLQDVLNDLENKFGIVLNQSVVRNIEFGVNLMDYITTVIILNALKLHKNKPFQTQYGNNYKQVKRRGYFVKAYNKGKQNKLKRQIFRFEIKSIRSEYHNKFGVYTLHDLTNKELFNKLGLELFNEWLNILYYDNTIDITKLTKKQKENLKDYRNIEYWHNCYQTQPNSTVRYRRELFESIQVKYSDNYKENIAIKILLKWFNLLGKLN